MYRIFSKVITIKDLYIKDSDGALCVTRLDTMNSSGTIKQVQILKTTSEVGTPCNMF